MGEPRCFLTGGYLRDRILGRDSADIDLSVEGDAEAVAGPARRLGRELGRRPHLLGQPPRSVWRLETATVKVELWPLGDLDLEADVLRRDFSCNALAWHVPDGPLVDLVGGVADLDNHRLRAISFSALENDPIRLLRGVRLYGQLSGFELEATTRVWIGELAGRLVSSPRERVGQELVSLLESPRAVDALTAMDALGLTAPAAPSGAAVDQGWLAGRRRALTALTEPAAHPVPDAVREAGRSARLGLLLQAWGVPSQRALSPYGWPRQLREQAGRAAAAVDSLRSALHAEAARRRELIHRIGEAWVAALALVAAGCDSPAEARAWRRWWQIWRRGGRCLLAPPPLLSTSEVAREAGVEAGPELGRLLVELRRAQVRGEVRSAGGARRLIRSLVGVM
jgi:tRNA nucleotidyltransferase/poly(A) polymerase